MANQLMTLTESAANHIKGLMANAPAGEEFTGLRVGVTASGCSGLSYSLEYAKEAQPMDVLVEDKGVKVYVDPKAQMYIAGMEMDYFEDKFESGFTFNNPNATGHCGCGKSFKV
ncbi:MAG TPA: iron-sulfur cluster assembly accessory protein [Patescibacteria group bacterium]|nr:iron-sulfur cluster assembly accessory protein [Patescibacteria group bacterium]